MRGRHPSGPEFAQTLAGSAQAKERLQVVLETVAGRCRVQAACARLGISEQRFDQIRIAALQAAVAALEPSPPGRPARVVTAAEVEAERLRDQVTELEAQRQAALLRAELAVTLPSAGEGAAKKARRPRRTRRPPAKEPS